MGSFHFISFLTIILVLETWSASSSSDLSSIIPPIFGDVCKGGAIQCGKGTCKLSNETIFGFECDCDAGWNQTRSEHDNGLKFLPCVIPNCSLDYGCNKAPAPAPPVNHSNESILDPCFWANCGGGTCNKTSPFTSNCICQEGYYNMFNLPVFPCLRDCALALDCSDLGIPVSNKSGSSSPPNPSDNSHNQGGLPHIPTSSIPGLPSGDFSWLIFSVLSLALVLGK